MTCVRLSHQASAYDMKKKKQKRKKNTHTQQKVSDAADPGIKCRSSLGWQAGRAALAATVGEWRWWGVGAAKGPSDSDCQHSIMGFHTKKETFLPPVCAHRLFFFLHSNPAAAARLSRSLFTS